MNARYSILLLVIASVSSTPGHAQPVKGSMLVGTDFFVSYSNKKFDVFQYYVQTSAVLNYFVSSNASVGMSIYPYWIKWADGPFNITRIKGIGFGPHGRLYKFIDQGSVGIFIEGGFDYSLNKTNETDEFDDPLDYETTTFHAYAIPGVSFRMGQKWFLELVFKGFVYEQYETKSGKEEYYGWGMKSVFNNVNDVVRLSTKKMNFPFLFGFRYQIK